MHRFAVVAALLITLVGCATHHPAGPCPPVGATPCPVFKGPDDAKGAPCAPACTEPDTPEAPPVPNGYLPWAEGFSGSLRFVIGDEVQITLPFYEDEDVTTTVAPDGNIYLELIGAIVANGRTPQSLEAELEQRYARFLKFPQVGVVPSAFASRQVYVGGEVTTPGVYPLVGPTGALEAVFQAGGFENTAHK